MKDIFKKPYLRDDKVHILEVQRNGNNLSIQLVDKSKNGINLKTREDAEKYLIENVFTNYLDDNVHKLDKSNPGIGLIHLSKASNNIAEDTRRACGNVLVCNAEQHSDIETFLEEGYNSGIPTGMYKVVKSDMLPKDEVVVLYSGNEECDQSMFYDQGELYLNSNASKYAVRLKVELI